MLEPGTLRGARGLVKYGYQVAAEVADFVLVLKTGDLGGRVIQSNPYVLTQAPLVFVMPTQAGPATWPIVSFTVADWRLTARLGPLRPKD